MGRPGNTEIRERGAIHKSQTNRSSPLGKSRQNVVHPAKDNGQEDYYFIVTLFLLRLISPDCSFSFTLPISSSAQPSFSPCSYSSAVRASSSCRRMIFNAARLYPICDFCRRSAALRCPRNDKRVGRRERVATICDACVRSKYVRICEVKVVETS